MPPQLREVRAELPCLAREAYLNAGGAGPLPRRVAAAIGAAMERDLARGRMGGAAIVANESGVAALRAEAGALLGARARQIAIAPNTTAAMGAVIWGVEWSVGDEAITTALEHPGLAAPLWLLARRRGVRVHVIPADEATHGLEAAIAALSGPRTRLVALSHVAYGTGALLDIAGAARAAAAAGALTLVDGAQSVGAVPVNPGALGVDAYAFPAHKWLLGPEGLGALWLAEGAEERLGVTFASFDSGLEHRPDGAFRAHPGARRFELSTPAFPMVPGWRAALAWLAELGWGWVHRRTAAAQEAARAALAALPGVSVLTPSGPQAGLVSFQVAGWTAQAACQALERAGVIVRWLAYPAAVRASTGFYTDQDDISRLAGAVAGLSSAR